MKIKNQGIGTVLLVAACAFFCATSAMVGNDHEKIDAVKLNVAAFEYAKELIKQGHVVADGRGEWAKHQPSAEAENEFIRMHGFGEYAKWHLGTDDRYAENTKRRYKFPYGDFKDVHRCGVLAAQSRAAEYEYYKIENAAAQLKAMIDMTREAHALSGASLQVPSFRRPSRQKSIDKLRHLIAVTALQNRRHGNVDSAQRFSECREVLRFERQLNQWIARVSIEACGSQKQIGLEF